MKTLIYILILLPALLYGQIEPKSAFAQTNLGVSPPVGKDSIQVEYATLMKIAAKYGVDKKFEFKPAVGNKSGKIPRKVNLKMSLSQFEDWMKNVAFNEKRVQILQQFYLKDFKELRSAKEYIALKRAYAKKYPEYLKDVPAFQEAEIQREEKHSSQISLNTKGFQKEVKN